jgi:ribosome-associated translation inhibitor RaiA
MENLEFILGALSMIGLLGLGYAVMGVFKVTQRSNGFDEAIDGIDKNMEDNHRELHLRIDGEICRVDRLQDDLYRYIDSRFDKFENRLKKIDKDGCEPVQKSKELLTD